MNRMVLIWILLLSFSAGNMLHGFSMYEHEALLSISVEQDTLKDNQSLYSGKIWKNMYRRVNGDQFLFVDYFLPGTVTSYGKTYKNLSIRYDIFSDEIMIPVSRDEIITLNKEMIDSFSIIYNDKAYKFSKISDDSLNGLNGISGYFYVLYKNKAALYIRYKKEISPDITEKSDGRFIETQKIYFVNNHIVYPISGTNDLFKALNKDEVKIRSYLKSNNFKVSKKRPESFVPVIRFYESLHK